MARFNRLSCLSIAVAAGLLAAGCNPPPASQVAVNPTQATAPLPTPNLDLPPDKPNPLLEPLVLDGVATKSFVNTRVGLEGEPAKHYADFSFDYPASWKLDPGAGKAGDPNFVKVERELKDKDGEWTLENFAVGYYEASGSAEGDKLLVPKLISQVNEQFKRGFPNYKQTSTGPTTIGTREGQEFRFSCELRPPGKEPIAMWGRAVLLAPEPGTRNGLFLNMMATKLAPEVKQESDLGVTGGLPVILKSFHLGAKAADGQKDKK